MIYNIHPLFVHFPIAFLLLYSLLRILPLERWIPKFAWGQIRLVVLILGVLGAIVASATGEAAEELVRPDRDIVEMHELFASISTWIYGLLLAGELFIFVNQYITKKFSNPTLIKLFHVIEIIITNNTFTFILATIGIITISLTGLLGGVMVYGTSADPLAPLVLKLFGLY